eukprot:844162-Rhodomonas_salina.2
MAATSSISSMTTSNSSDPLNLSSLGVLDMFTRRPLGAASMHTLRSFLLTFLFLFARVITSGWAAKFVAALEKSPRHKHFGVVGGRDLSNQLVMTQSMVHRTHQVHFPPTFACRSPNCETREISSGFAGVSCLCSVVVFAMLGLSRKVFAGFRRFSEHTFLGPSRIGTWTTGFRQCAFLSCVSHREISRFFAEQRLGIELKMCLLGTGPRRPSTSTMSRFATQTSLEPGMESAGRTRDGSEKKRSEEDESWRSGCLGEKVLRKTAQEVEPNLYFALPRFLSKHM